MNINSYSNSKEWLRKNCTSLQKPPEPLTTVYVNVNVELQIVNNIINQGSRIHPVPSTETQEILCLCLRLQLLISLIQKMVLFSIFNHFYLCQIGGAILSVTCSGPSPLPIVPPRGESNFSNVTQKEYIILIFFLF